MLTRSAAIAFLTSATALFGCNALTGADDITIDGDESKDSGSGNGSGTGDGTGTGPGDGTDTGLGTLTDTGAATGTDTGTGTGPGTELVDAQGVTVGEIAIYQGVKKTLAQNGSAVGGSTPVVAGRPALVRVFPQTNSAYDGSPVTARLFVDGTSFDVTGPVNGNPSETSPNSTINFQVPGSAIQAGSSFRVELKQPSSVSVGGNPAANFPADGSSLQPLGAQSPGASLNVRLIPIAYAADGSNRLPDTSPGQLQAYEDAFMAMYPVPNINISVGQSVSWPNAVNPLSQSGWSNLLNAMADYRISDGAPSNTYYYGIFSPASTLGQFCSGGCISGLGFVGSASDNYTRTAIGLGFPGSGSIETAVHEVGHNHGRNHSPCGGAGGPDPNYPYGGGAIGSWGYNILNGQLYAPNQYADMMGYCDPAWISDYTFTAIFNRVKSVNGAKMYFPPEMKNLTWERAIIGGDEDELLEPITLENPPVGEPRSVVINTPTGSMQVEGSFFEFDHIDGGVVFWPQGSEPTVSAVVEQNGVNVQINKISNAPRLTRITQ